MCSGMLTRTGSLPVRPDSWLDIKTPSFPASVGTGTSEQSWAHFPQFPPASSDGCKCGELRRCLRRSPSPLLASVLFLSTSWHQL